MARPHDSGPMCTRFAFVLPTPTARCVSTPLRYHERPGTRSYSRAVQRARLRTRHAWACSRSAFLAGEPRFPTAARCGTLPVAWAQHATQMSASSDKTILVTGGTGFIGRRLLGCLREADGVRAVALARPSSDLVSLARLLDYPGCDTGNAGEGAVRVAELHDPDALATAVRGVNAVVHLAADMDFFPKDPSRLFRVNVDGTRNLLDACVKEASRTGASIRFLYISSVEALGPARTTDAPPTPEDVLPAPDCAYGRSKVEAESVALGDAYKDKLDVCVLRPTGIYGPNEQFFVRELFEAVESGLFFVAPGPLDGTIQFSHVDDVVTAIMLALPKSPSRVYNVCPNDSVTYLDLLKAISDVFGRPAPKISVSLAFAARAVSLLGPLLNFGRRRTFLWHPDSLWKTRTRRVYSNEAIKRDLGFSPRPSILEGIRETAIEGVASGDLPCRKINPLLVNCGRVGAVLIFVLTRVLLSKKSSE